MGDQLVYFLGDTYYFVQSYQKSSCVRCDQFTSKNATTVASEQNISLVSIMPLSIDKLFLINLHLRQREIK